MSKKNNKGANQKKRKKEAQPQHLNQRAANNNINAVTNGAKTAGKLVAYTAVTITGTAVLAAAAVATGTNVDIDTARKAVSVVKRPFHKARYINGMGEDVTKILTKAAKAALRKGV